MLDRCVKCSKLLRPIKIVLPPAVFSFGNCAEPMVIIGIEDKETLFTQINFAIR